MDFSKLPVLPCPESLSILAEMKPSNLQEAWEKYPRGDHLLWFVQQIGIERKLLVLAACDCVEPALAHIPAHEERPKKALEVTRAWCVGDASLEDVRQACRITSYAYLYAAATDASSAAAVSVVSAVCAAGAAALSAGAAAEFADTAAGAAAVAAAYAAAADASAVYATASVSARKDSLRKSADLVRARIPWPMIEKHALEMGVI